MSWSNPYLKSTLLFGAHSVPSFEINLDVLRIEQVSASQLAMLQPEMSRAIWRPAPGRKLAFVLRHNDVLLGLIFLASPVFNLSARDIYLSAPKEPKHKGEFLKGVMDMSVCVGAQPISWYWNIGKLLALIAPTLGDYIREQYPDNEFVGLTTTSLFGRGSQYNRIWKFLGYTKGHGHEHVSDNVYDAMCASLVNAQFLPSTRFGAGPNARMRRIEAYRKKFGGDVRAFHGKLRAVYWHPAIDYTERSKVMRQWYERWGFPRWERKQHEIAPYLTGLGNESIARVWKPA